jgi:N-acetylmuramoyl-L-alanine amidase
MPAVLVEIGFISNPEEAALMRSSPEVFAQGIYNGIVEYTGIR